MSFPEVERALRASFETLRGEFGDIIVGMGAVDLMRGTITEWTYNLPPVFLRTHGRIVNLLRKHRKLDFGSYYLFETEDRGLVVVFNVASRFAFVVYVKLDTVQMGTVLKVLLRELKDILSTGYSEEILRRIEKIMSVS